MDPRAGLVRYGTCFLERIKCPGVNVAGLQTQDGSRPQLGNAFRDQATLAVHRHAYDAVASKAQHAESLQQRSVRFVADHDVDGRRSEEALALDVPAFALEQRVPCRG